MLIPGNFTPSEPSDNMATLPIYLQLFWRARNIVLTKAQGPLARSLHLIELFPSDVATDRTSPLDSTTDSGAVPRRVDRPPKYCR